MLWIEQLYFFPQLKIQESNFETDSINSFRKLDRKYKTCLHPDVDYQSEIFDFLEPSNLSDQKINLGTRNVHGIRNEASCWTIQGFEGLLIYPSLFVESDQISIGRECLESFNDPEISVRNIDAHIAPPENNIWQREKQFVSNLEYPLNPNLPKSCVLSKLRWATLGYHYNWTERKYDKDKHSQMPLSILDMAESVADASGYRNMKAEAVIVNYYQATSTMGGHQNDAEETMEYPVISVSLGLSCVFLIGGASSRSEDAVGIILRSGDVMVMGGRCRLCYHGVSHIISESSRCLDDSDDNESSLVRKYLNHHRINVNIRQVY